jgi:hypothetical protein
MCCTRLVVRRIAYAYLPLSIQNVCYIKELVLCVFIATCWVEKNWSSLEVCQLWNFHRWANVPAGANIFNYRLIELWDSFVLWKNILLENLQLSIFGYSFTSSCVHNIGIRPQFLDPNASFDKLAISYETYVGWPSLAIFPHRKHISDSFDT